MTIAIIAARGGSKRLPRKNILPFCGKPLLAWSIINAQCSMLVDEVWVTTDDDEIEEISTNYGAKVIRRPDWPDADLAAANRPFIHATKILKERYSDFDTMLSILPTTPLVPPREFDKAISLYREYGCDYIRPLIPKREFVALRKIHPFKTRTVIFDKSYGYLGEAGGYCVTSPEWYVKFNSEFSDIDSELNNMDNWPASEAYFFPVEYWEYADVDTAEEFEFGELLMEHYILKGRGADVYKEYIETRKAIEDGGAQISLQFGNSNQLGGLEQLH